VWWGSRTRRGRRCGRWRDRGSDADGDFDAFYRDAYDRLVGQLHAVTGNLADAEDVVQEAFARASVRWRRVRALDRPEARVRRVALNLAIDQARRLRRRLRSWGGPARQEPEWEPEEPELLDALRGLPIRYRQVLVLHYVVGLSAQETATELRIAVGTVHAYLSRGRQALADRLTQDARRG